MVSFSFLNAIDPTTIVFIVLLALLIVALLVVPMFTNKKRARQTDELHRSLKPGDLVKTIGGVVGTIVEIRQISPVDKEMVIETGVEGSKTTMVFDIQALYQVMSRSSTIVPAKDEPEATEDAAVSQDDAATENVVTDKVAAPVETEVKEEVVQPAEKAEAEQAAVAEEAAVEEKTEADEAPAAKTAQKGSTGKKTSGATKKTNK